MIHTNLMCKPYEELVEQLEEAVGHVPGLTKSHLGLPKSLERMSALDLEFLIMKIKSIDIIYSGCSPYIVHAIKQAIIRLIRRKMEEKQETAAFEEAVMGLGRLISI